MASLRIIWASRSDIYGANQLLRKIQAGKVADGDSVRDVRRHQWSGLTTPESVTGALEVLDEYGWARAEDAKGDAGRPGRIIRINPAANGGANA